MLKIVRNLFLILISKFRNLQKCKAMSAEFTEKMKRYFSKTVTTDIAVKFVNKNRCASAALSFFLIKPSLM